MPGTGKTFTGDYLELVHGFKHVDGDLPFRTAEKPGMDEVNYKFFELNRKYPFLKGTRSSDEQLERCKQHGIKLEETEQYWEPFFQAMVDNTLEAANTNEKVVVTFKSQFRRQREFIMQKLKEGGANNVTLMCLTMNQDKKLEGIYYRTKKDAASSGMTHGGLLLGFGEEPWAGPESPTLEEFLEVAKRPGQLGDDPFELPPSYAKVVDVTARDVSTIDGVDAALGLQRPNDLTYEEIKDKVLAVDVKRNEEMPYNCMHIIAEVNKKYEENKSEDR